MNAFLQLVVAVVAVVPVGLAFRDFAASVGEPLPVLSEFLLGMILYPLVGVPAARLADLLGRTIRSHRAARLAVRNPCRDPFSIHRG